MREMSLNCRFNIFYYAFILLGCFHLVQSAYLRFCYNNGTLDDYQEIPLSDGKLILNYSCFDTKKSTFFYIFGSNGTTNGPATTSVMSAAITLSDTLNVILVNWQKEASSIDAVQSLNPITGQISYVFKGIPAAFDVGTELGNTIVCMAKAGLDLNTVYIVGHSLGAQLAGQAGRTVRKSNLSVGVIIGLDPAGPLYDKPSVLPSLSSGCASFVYTVRSDPGGYGTNESLADVDIFLNCKPFFVETDPEKQVQPGCPVGQYPKFSEKDMCSHNFCWKPFSESLKLNHTLPAKKVASCLDWLAGGGNSSDYVYIGLDIDQSKRGIYCLKTNSDSPYGQGLDGLNPPPN